jgi:predicted porin
MPGASSVNTANIVVGEAEVKVGVSNTTMTNSDFDTLASVGGTQEGVEISWEPDMVDIEVDQYGDAAKVIQSRVKVMLKTTLAEATLNNLAIAWSYDPTNGGDDIKANLDGANTKTLLFGVQNVYPFEKAVQIVGNAPGSNATVTKTRKFNTKRAVSFESSSISMKRAEASVFAVSFRILPVSSDVNYEYGKIIDEI